MRQQASDIAPSKIFFDADCPFCVRAVRRAEPFLWPRHFEMVALQTPGVSTELGVPDVELLKEMRLRLPDGSVFGGASAVVEIARRVWWAWPMWALSRVPGAMRSLDVVYRWIADNRTCEIVHTRDGLRTRDTVAGPKPKA